MSRSASDMQSQLQGVRDDDDQEPTEQDQADQNDHQNTRNQQPRTAADPNRFFLHTKHILNRVEEAIFASPVLVKPNPQNFDHLYGFPPLALPARLADQGHVPGQAPAISSDIVNRMLTRAREPVAMPPLCQPSPPCEALRSTPEPRLLVEGHASYFNIIKDYLTLQEYTYVFRLNKRMFQNLVFDPQTKEYTFNALSFWSKRFKLLCLGPHIHAPDIQSVQVLYPWVRVLYLQQALAHHKRQLDLDLVTAHQLLESTKSSMIEALIQKFRSRTHSCGICTASVPYSTHLGKNHKKVVDIVYMSCEKCAETQLWNLQELNLWHIPDHKLKDLSAWRLPAAVFYQTKDLLRKFRSLDLKDLLEGHEITLAMAKRYKDLPKEVKAVIYLEVRQKAITIPLRSEIELEKYLAAAEKDPSLSFHSQRCYPSHGFGLAIESEQVPVQDVEMAGPGDAKSKAEATHQETGPESAQGTAGQSPLVLAYKQHIQSSRTAKFAEEMAESHRVGSDQKRYKVERKS